MQILHDKSSSEVEFKEVGLGDIFILLPTKVSFIKIPTAIVDKAVETNAIRISDGKPFFFVQEEMVVPVESITLKYRGAKG